MYEAVAQQRRSRSSYQYIYAFVLLPGMVLYVTVGKKNRLDYIPGACVSMTYRFATRRLRRAYDKLCGSRHATKETCVVVLLSQGTRAAGYICN